MKTRVSQRRRLAQATRNVVENTREVRRCFNRVTELVLERHAEFVLIEDNGSGPLQERRYLTPDERVERLEWALNWNRKGADLARRNEALLVKAIEKELQSL